VAGGARADQDGSLVGQLVDAAVAVDSPRIEAVLDDMFAAGTYERVIEDEVIPSLRAIGDAWAEGRLPVAGEHVASHAIQRRLAASFQASGPGREQGRPVLVGMPPGARHELGGLIFATAARRAGLPVVYLGADLPLDDWIAAVERTGARAVVIGAVMRTDAAGALAVASGLRDAARPDLLIAFGGAAAPEPEGGNGRSPATIRLPGDVRAAVAALGAALTRTATTRPGAR
jgi:methanogenic corrinoid protein MtbC1